MSIISKAPLIHAFFMTVVTFSATAFGYVVQPGDTLSSLGESQYGHVHYAVFLQKLNRLDGNDLKAGASIKIPDLKEVLVKEGVPAAAESSIEQILAVRYEVMRLKGDITRALTPGNSKAPVKVGAILRAALLKEAAKLERAGKELARLGGFQDSPTRMRQRLDLCAKVLKDLAAGKQVVDPYGEMHLLFAQTFVRGLMWGRKEDKHD